ISDCAAMRLALMTYCLYEGYATLARIPATAIEIINSIKVNPFFFRYLMTNLPNRLLTRVIKAVDARQRQATQAKYSETFLRCLLPHTHASNYSAHFVIPSNARNL